MGKLTQICKLDPQPDKWGIFSVGFGGKGTGGGFGASLAEYVGDHEVWGPTVTRGEWIPCPFEVEVEDFYNVRPAKFPDGWWWCRESKSEVRSTADD